MEDVTIALSPEPRRADTDAFIVWLKEHGVRSPDPSKIKSTTRALSSLKFPGIKGFVSSRNGVEVAFTQGSLLVHDFRDYRLTYDARSSSL